MMQVKVKISEKISGRYKAAFWSATFFSSHERERNPSWYVGTSRKQRLKRSTQVVRFPQSVSGWELVGKVLKCYEGHSQGLSYGCAQ